MSSRRNKAPEARGVSIRWSLFRSVVLLILFFFAAILGIMNHFRSEEVRSLSASLITRTIDRMGSEMDAFFDPVRENLFMAREWGRGKLFDPAHRDPANALFMPVLRRYQQISGVSTGDLDENNYFLSRESDRWYNRVIRHENQDKHVEWWQWDNEGTLLAHGEEDDYELHERPWYTHWLKWLAAGRGNGGTSPVPTEVHWTEPYEFHRSKKLGITASIFVSTDNKGNNGRSYVLAMDVLVDEISRFTIGYEPSSNGMAFILTDGDRVIGLPRHERFLGTDEWRQSVLSEVKDLGIAALNDALKNVQSEKLTEHSPYPFESGGRAWWGGFQSYSLGGQRKIRLGVVVPEADFLGVVEQQWGLFVFVTLLALGAVALLAGQLARAYSDPLKELLGHSERMSRLDLTARKRTESSLREVNALADAQERMRSTLESFARYVPTDIVRELLRRGEAAKIGGSTRTLTVVFTDIRGFTAICESMTPTALTEHMAEYFGAMLAILIPEGATVDKFIGDAILAFWGAPEPDPQHATRAVSAILRCQKRLEDLNRNWRDRGLPALPTRMGLASGPAVVGNVGAPDRLSYTALGDTVNLASRLEGLNRIYGTDVLVSAATFKGATGEAFLWRRIDRVAVKGKTESVEIYEPLGRRGEVPPEVTSFAACYEAALARYQGRRFDEALEALNDLEKAYSEDLSVKRLTKLCREYHDHGPPEDWDGTTRLEFK